MALKDEIDPYLKLEIEEECTKYGKVKQVVIHEVMHWSVKPAEVMNQFTNLLGCQDICVI